MKVNLFKRGRTWHVYYYQDGRTIRRSLKVENRKVAEDLRRKLEWRLNAGEEPKPRRRVGLTEFTETYRGFSLSRKRPKSHRVDIARLEEFLACLDVAVVQDVTTAHVSDFLSRIALEGRSATTVLRYREVLMAFFNHAKRLGHIAENPVALVPRPQLAERDPRFLSRDQIDELLAVVNGDLIAPIVATLIYAGLRREEVCWLTWSDLQLRSRPPVLPFSE